VSVCFVLSRSFPVCFLFKPLVLFLGSTSANGEEGLAVAAREKPDVIVLDITMPVMDGITMLTKLKSDPALRPIPVFMLTAESGREVLLQVAKIGVRDYLVKPFSRVGEARRSLALASQPARFAYSTQGRCVGGES